MIACIRISSFQSEIESLEAKLTLLKSKRAEIMACIINEEENIKTVEEELSEEKLQLKSERAEFQERQDRLSDQQVKHLVATQALSLLDTATYRNC